MQRLGEAPLIFVEENFLGAEECSALFELMGEEDFVTSNAIFYKSDHCGYCAKFSPETHPLLGGLASKLEAHVGIHPAVPLTLRFRYYQPGEGHPPHRDTYPEGDAILALSMLLSLADTEEGGETHFPLARPAPLSVAPRRGRLTTWWSLRANGEEDPASLHEGLTIRSGIKAVMLAFFYLSPEQVREGVERMGA